MSWVLGILYSYHEKKQLNVSKCIPYIDPVDYKGLFCGFNDFFVLSQKENGKYGNEIFDVFCTKPTRTQGGNSMIFGDVWVKETSGGD